MKVVQINSVCGIGSTGRIAVDISKNSNNAGIENYILYGVGESNYENSIKVGGVCNVRAHQLGTRILGKHGFYSKKVTKKIIDTIKNINPDIIHLHNIHGHYLNIDVLFTYLKQVQKPVIWTLHDCWSFTGHCAYFDWVGCDRWKAGCYKCPQKMSYPGSWIFDRSQKSWLDKKRLFTQLHDMTIVTPSKWLANLVSESFLNEYPTKVINNGINLSVFKPSSSDFKKKLGIENKYMILGVALGFDKRKGFKYFIELAAQLKENQVIVMVGVKKNLISTLPSNIFSLERTDNIEELVDIYTAADVFVNPTLEDNFPTVNLEALACGTPVITFDTGGSPESLTDDCGFTVKEKTVNALFEAINMFYSKGKPVEACINHAKKYDKNHKFLEYVRLYEEKGLNK